MVFDWAQSWDELTQEMILLPRKPRQGKCSSTKDLTVNYKSVFYVVCCSCVGVALVELKLFATTVGHLFFCQ